jgi:hypothetical protein
MACLLGTPHGRVLIILIGSIALVGGRNLFALDHIVKDFSFEIFLVVSQPYQSIVQNDVLASYYNAKVSVFEKACLTPKKYH